MPLPAGLRRVAAVLAVLGIPIAVTLGCGRDGDAPTTPPTTDTPVGSRPSFAVAGANVVLSSSSDYGLVDSKDLGTYGTAGSSIFADISITGMTT
jgi:hypothetical protein